MDIIINKEKIDFELSGSENCSAIIEDLREWLFKKKHIILNSVVNGEKFEAAQHGAFVIADIKKIEIDSEHIEILTINSIGELKNYGDRVQTYIDKIKNDNSAFDDNKILEVYMQVKDGYSWCLKAIENIAKVLNIDIDNADWTEKHIDFKNKLNDIECVFDSKKARALFTDGIIEVINTKLLEIIVYLFNELKNKKTLLSFDEIIEKTEIFKNELDKLKNELPVIAEKLQIGESVDAMNLLKEKFALLENIINFYYQIQCSVSIEYENLKVREKGLQEYLNDYLKLMKDLLSAMETKDYVMLADLLEYEVSEYISVFLESFQKIKEIINNLKVASE